MWEKPEILRLVMGFDRPKGPRHVEKQSLFASRCEPRSQTWAVYIYLEFLLQCGSALASLDLQVDFCSFWFETRSHLSAPPLTIPHEELARQGLSSPPPVSLFSERSVWEMPTILNLSSQSALTDHTVHGMLSTGTFVARSTCYIWVCPRFHRGYTLCPDFESSR